MKLISVNVGKPRPVAHEGRVVSTGIFKEPVAGPVFLRRLNLDGDGQADLRVHGGTDKAVYVYPFEHYAFWAGELGRDDFAHGQFGENFTITGWLEDTVCIGDEFRIGAARVQVTQPRSPCFKLGIRMGDDQFPARFAAANRTGFYLRVLQEGRVSAGDAIERVAHDAGSLSVRDVFRLRHDRGTREEYERAVKLSALSPSWRAVFEKQLKEMNNCRAQ
jgi:MOSC domain-containing protein YiiM